MKILMVNKFHYLKGGSEKYYFELARLLKENGHEIAFFSMKDDKNIKTDCKEYFVDPIDLNSGSKLKALDVIYSKKNEKKMEEALEDFKPDIVHLNNFQRQLSASIIEPIKKKNIPIVFTAHDLEAICPNKTMLNNDKEICEKCVGGHYLNCIKGKCIKGSGLKSILGAVETRYYRNKKIFTSKIDKIITPSEFYKKQLIKDGITEGKIVAIHNFLDIEMYNYETKDDGYALYFGRLSKEKGIINLIEAFKDLKLGNLYIAGDGPEKEKIQEIISKCNLGDKIKLLGFLNADEMKECIRKCKFVILPSIWYDNCPYSIMESLVIGKPVIGSNIAGIPELVKNNENGFTFDPNSIKELSEKMKILFEDENLVKQFSENAKINARRLYSKENYYREIIKIYNELVEGV